MEQNRKIADEAGGFRRLARWASGIRFIGVHRARIARLTTATALSGWSGKTGASAAKLPRSSSSVGKLPENSSNAAAYSRLLALIHKRLVAFAAVNRAATTKLPFSHQPVENVTDRSKADRLSDSSVPSESQPPPRFSRFGTAFVKANSSQRAGQLASLPRPISTFARRSAIAIGNGQQVERRPTGERRATILSGDETLRRVARIVRASEIVSRFSGVHPRKCMTPQTGDASHPDREGVGLEELRYHSTLSLENVNVASPGIGKINPIASAQLTNARINGLLTPSDRGFGAPTRIAAFWTPAAAVPIRSDGSRVAAFGITGDRSAGLVINSSPTIVIHEANSAGDIEAGVLEALRHHAGELYDQWRREADRRRRTEF
jgi:hypothetical protein